ncbi:zinc finger FYVE domain protein isoform X2 [Wolffia australiana]
MEEEDESLCRAAANYLFLGQFEALRAVILSLHARQPELARAILTTIVAEGGRFDGVLWSGSCRSPAHLAWMSTIELLQIGNSPFDPDSLRIKAECLLLVEQLCSWASEENCDDVNVEVLRRMSDYLVGELKNEVAAEADGTTDNWFSCTEEELKGLCDVVLGQSDVLDVVCRNIRRQIDWSRNSVSELAVSVVGGKSSVAGGLEELVGLPREVQKAHLRVLIQCVEKDDIVGAVSRLRFLHTGFGVEESDYRAALIALLKKFLLKEDQNRAWLVNVSDLLLMYTEALSSCSSEIMHIIQDIQDELYEEEIKRIKLSEKDAIHLPFQKYLAVLKSGKSEALDEETFRSSATKYAMRELYHYARISGLHVLGCIMDTTLSLIKQAQLHDAGDVLSLFPLLQPLAAVLGWDLLRGKTTERRKLLWKLWTSRSHILRLERLSVQGQHFDEGCCIEYLCELLCYHLDLASFSACVNSGECWDSGSYFLLSASSGPTAQENIHSDPFVENYVLERLSVQTPIRVLFDTVPGMESNDAIKFVRMQPLPFKSAYWKILHDVELINMRYGVGSAVQALGSMEMWTEEDKHFYDVAVVHLKYLGNHLEAVSDIPRKIFMLSLIMLLLRMDGISSSEYFFSYPCHSSVVEQAESPEAGDINMVVSFARRLLEIFRGNLQACVVENLDEGVISSEARHAVEWRISNLKVFLKGWEWRLSVLECLIPSNSFKWRGALAFFRTDPSKLLNLCIQRAQYAMGKEAVHLFSLPPEDRVALELSEWLTTKDMKVSSILLCVDAAATSSKSLDKCKLLLNQASGMLSDINPEGALKGGSAYWSQVQEIATITVVKRVLQRLHDLLDEEEAPVPAEIFSGRSLAHVEPKMRRQRRRAVAILNQIIDDAHKGRRQFLSGKLHNLSRALADDVADDGYLKEKGIDYHMDREKTLMPEDGTVLGLGLRLQSNSREESINRSSTKDVKDPVAKFFGPLSSKPSTYLSAFIIYIATIGDIVDGIDTTHDFNFFSLLYEWPKDLLTRLVFERGSIDAAAKVAEIMCVDFVHEIISACVPPVFPPISGDGWASVPVLSSSLEEEKEMQDFFNPSRTKSIPSSPPEVIPSLYPLKLDIVKHLVKLSPVRAILGCVFGSCILFKNNDSSPEGESLQVLDAERLLYEFALDQSERFGTLNRWIQMQSNLCRVSESAKAATAMYDVASGMPKGSYSVKRLRESEADVQSEVVETVFSSHDSVSSADAYNQVDGIPNRYEESSTADGIPDSSTMFLSLDWENEAPYEKAVERLIDRGKLVDALALSDRFLRCGASDRLLKLLIERGEVNTPIFEIPQGSTQTSADDSWQYCLRLKDKELAARLALKNLHRWGLDAGLEVLLMCSCHLPPDCRIRTEVLQRRHALLRYKSVLNADDSFSCWQEVEAHCEEDPEGLALRLAGKGAVSAALEVANSVSLSLELKRELQAQQLVKLLTTDPLSGGGPAEAARFLSSLNEPGDSLAVAISAMQLLPDLRSKQLLVHFFLKRRGGDLSEPELTRLNSWAMGLRVLAVLPLPWQQKCSGLHEHPHLIVEVLLMMKHLQYASMILKRFTSLCDDNMILVYAAKAISVNLSATPREPRLSVPMPRYKQKKRMPPTRATFTSSLSNLQKEAYRAFSWSRDRVIKSTSKDVTLKRKNQGTSPDRGSWETMTGASQDQSYSTDFQERPAFISAAEEWVLTGDPNKDAAIRSSHKYESVPDISLFKELLSLCSDELKSAGGALILCITQMKKVLNSQMVPLNASMETIGQAYHGTEVFVQALSYTRNLLRRQAGTCDQPSFSEKNREMEDESTDTGSPCTVSQGQDELSELISQADLWQGRAELLQSLLGSGIVASLDDIADDESSARLRDRLIENERYGMAIYTCKKCKIDAFTVWNSWGHALLRIEHYAQARVKFKQALQLYKGDPVTIIEDILNTMEGGPPVDISAVRSMYDHLERSASTILDDSLSADSYLNVLYMPSTFPRSERSRLSERSSNNQSMTDSDDGPRSNLDNIRLVECKYYLQEFARQKLLSFLFRHGHYLDACILFFPLDAVPSLSQQSHSPGISLSSQRSDPLATDYGTIEDLCELCVGYGAMSILEGVLSDRHAKMPEDSVVRQYILLSLTRVCSFCETHRHFNYLYKFQVIRGDHVAAGLCCIQLFMNSTTQEEAIRHLEHAKTHFEEGLSARHRGGETKLATKTTRRKSASEKLSEEGLVKLSARAAIQTDVIKAFNETDQHRWEYSLFGNPSDPDTFRRRCKIAEKLAEKNFDLAFQIIHEFNLPAPDIYAAVAASLAERKRGSQLTDFLKNIKGLIDEEDWDQVLGAAINVYANKHKERPDRLIDMLTSSHRKVLACVICGRLKSAFQIASRSGSVADVQYVAHQALHANALPVLDMCKQWLAQYM